MIDVHGRLEAARLSYHVLPIAEHRIGAEVPVKAIEPLVMTDGGTPIKTPARNGLPRTRKLSTAAAESEKPAGAFWAWWRPLLMLISSQGCGGPQKLRSQSTTPDNIRAAPVAFTFRNGVGDVILQS